jgi:hypothetical protein
VEKKVFYYRVDKKRDQNCTPNEIRYQLLQVTSEISYVLGEFDRLPVLKKFIRTYFPGAVLKEFPKKLQIMDKPSSFDIERLYLPLQGNAPRGLSWGMSRKRVSRVEQIDGGERLLMKTESMHGFDAVIQFGFDEWAHCGLEYIAYSSPEPSFLEIMEKELNQNYGTPERVVDYHNLDRMIQAGKIKVDEMLIRFIKEPESPAFNHFIAAISGLTFRSALKWKKDHTACLMYTRHTDCQGERNRHNRPHVVEFFPTLLFDFYQERFAELYLPTSDSQLTIDN